eukprot:TRINITY_DN50850_c0_g1_i1.p1 TRINITY_DN50850_c0_g1~~TRINITY_DN50850_c0_g1_i1.p1  ORF type:complete len:294 (+),score=73.26 TRINITY_DN50850_c0_g1_i1:33-914(+)
MPAFTGTGPVLPQTHVAEKAAADMLTEQVTLTDGTTLELLRSPEMTEAQWQETRLYLQSNPAEAKKLADHSTNPDMIRKRHLMRVMADEWQVQIDNGSQEFAAKLKELEQDPEFQALFGAVKDYQVQKVRTYLDDADLMAKISDKMGGVPQRASRELDKFVKTPITLQEACKFGDLRALQHYLSETDGVPGSRDLEAKDHRGVTCLGYAVGANRMPIAKLLVEVKADMNCVDKAGNTSVHYAAGYGREDMLTYLLDQGAGMNMSNSSGQSPLDVATKNQQSKAVQLLRSRGAG